MHVSLYTASSLDMKIADMNHSVEFLDWVDHIEGEDYGYYAFYESIQGVVMGRKTYDISLELGKGTYPYQGKESIVFSRSKTVQFQSENDVIAVSDINSFKSVAKSEKFWLVGGGELTKEFLNENMIDEMIVTVFPICLGAGIPLFPDGISPKKFNLKNHRSFDNGILELTYLKI